jgi:ferric-dicitrate binding protein FerR (iron transport regulator)
MVDKPMVDKPMVDKNAEAARWFAASRRGAMLHEERAAYEDWKRDPENAARLGRFQATWLGLELEPRSDAIEPPAAFPLEHAAVSHRRQLAAMVAFVSVTAVILTRVDGGWWSTLDWWSR